MLREISAEELVKRAVRAARPNDVGTKTYRWAAVMETFGLGSTYAHELCRLMGLDPDEQLSGPTCGTCADVEALEQAEFGSP